LSARDSSAAATVAVLATAVAAAARLQLGCFLCLYLFSFIIKKTNLGQYFFNQFYDIAKVMIIHRKI
jgi:hypothetical protein